MTKEWIQAAPIMWSVVGASVASLIFWAASRKVLSLQGVAATKLAETLSRQIVALEHERDDYRNKLHDERDCHQDSKLRIKELELRPDLSSISALLGDQREWMQTIAVSITDHADSDAKIFAKIQQSLEQILEKTK